MTGPGGDPLERTHGGKPRARGLGLPFEGVPGRWNSVTDVGGVAVGYTALIRGEGRRTVGTGAFGRTPPINTI